MRMHWPKFPVSAYHKLAPASSPAPIIILARRPAAAFIKQKHYPFFCCCYSSSTRKNYYDILKITPKSSTKQVKEAYFRLSKIYHPDLNKDNQSAHLKFQEISEAYQVLSHSQLRKEYDRDFIQYASKFNRKTPDMKSQDQRKSRIYTGKTDVYDYDEWLKNHYDDYFIRRKERPPPVPEDSSEEVIDKNLERKSVILFIGSMTFVVVIWILYIKQGYSDWDRAKKLSDSAVAKKSEN